MALVDAGRPRRGLAHPLAAGVRAGARRDGRRAGPARAGGSSCCEHGRGPDVLHGPQRARRSTTVPSSISTTLQASGERVVGGGACAAARLPEGGRPRRRARVPVRRVGRGRAGERHAGSRCLGGAGRRHAEAAAGAGRAAASCGPARRKYSASRSWRAAACRGRGSRRCRSFACTVSTATRISRARRRTCGPSSGLSRSASRRSACRPRDSNRERSPTPA